MSRSRPKEQVTTTVLEDLYFHISNGGLSVKVVEKITVREPAISQDFAGDTRRKYRMEVTQACMGEYVSFSLPLNSPVMIGTICDALQRTAERMSQSWDDSKDKWDAFDDTSAGVFRRVKGMDVRPEWSAETVTSTHSSESRFERFVLVDEDGDEVEEFKAPGNFYGSVRGSGSTGGEGQFRAEDIGKTVASVTKRRRSDAAASGLAAAYGAQPKEDLTGRDLYAPVAEAALKTVEKTPYQTHVTRYSDSSLYDEKCVNCGGTDARGDDSLNEVCPLPNGRPDGRKY